ncbi:hypothetical protein SDRG_03843 [Saprolegnia diclina VS20]|uniref:Uncharacterized protein n=1 Tax=Saprolegnia diclina (strain VS20) TaxID=1156394 RepID=T0QXV6_SAPDV|nr:hypothetical protein SDRG_03843 [Saprolegnia diclina VS20]EQC38885.1 hypothetical protein SDRG_03843 [Saprolegnia diclina VS20]|eukprot:XP_008607709.1 hypothetical protein SDRG_03843 [Saprolegnia diclina VS20]
MEAWVKKTTKNERYVDTSTVETDLGLGSVDSMRLMRSIVSSALEQDAVVRALRMVHVDDDLRNVRTTLWLHAPFDLEDDVIIVLKKKGKNSRPLTVTALGMAAIHASGRALLVSTHNIRFAQGAPRGHRSPPATNDVEVGAAQVEVLLRAVVKSGCTPQFRTGVIAKMKTPPETKKSRHKKNKGGSPNLVARSTLAASAGHHEAAQQKKTAEKDKAAKDKTSIITPPAVAPSPSPLTA